MADDQTPGTPEDEAPDGASDQPDGVQEASAQSVEASATGGAQAQVEGEEQADGERSPATPQPAAPAEPLAQEQPEVSEEEDEPEPDAEPATRVKPTVPGAHLEVDIVPEGVDPLGHGEEYEDPYASAEEQDGGEQAEQESEGEQAEELAEPISTAAIDLASGARYRATGKRKTAIARVTLRPGSGTYLVNGRSLEEHFPRLTLQRNIRQPLETVGYEDRMDVIARLGGGGISAQAGALRHGVSRALLEADPNLRGELKRRGFLTRDSRAKERKKAGLKKARKRPQFSKR
jgi:small subunit ribosomal protein S9